MENVFEPIIISAVIVSLLIELFKLIYRRLVIKDLDYSFSPYFYTVAVPVLNILIQPVMAFLMPESFSLPADWVAFGRTVILTALASVATFVTNDYGLKGIKFSFLRERKPEIVKPVTVA